MKLVKSGNLLKTNYEGIKKGKTYTVYGMVLYEDSIIYLLYDEYQMANWYPGELFEVIDHKIPSNWYYQFYGYQEIGISAIWGYRELVLSKEHYNGLGEQDSDEVALFFKNKEVIDRDILILEC
jgi:hypothetical protein